MTEPAAIDLELELRVGEPAGRTVEVEVLRSPAGEATELTTLPFDTLELDNRLKDVQIALLGRSATTRRIVPEYERAVQQFGDLLFDTVFTGEVRSLLDRSREEAIKLGVGLRVKLRFESADMASLPWEFLHDPRRDEYLALSRTTPIVRHVELAEPQRPLTVTRPLRVLAMVASPSDLPALDIAQERARIDSAVAGLEGYIELHWLEGQTWRDLQSALQREKWHVFHFIGHGGFDATRGEGIVALCDDAGEAHNLGASELGLLLGDHDSLRLTVLNSCDGARADKLDIFSSTAAVLVRKGTPAVIAMQYAITDRAAIELSRSFYAAIARGLPVDMALTEARKAVALALPGTVEWGTPVLHLRAHDGRIFEVNSDPQGRDVAPPRPSPAPQAAARPGRRWKAPAIAAGIAAVLLVGGGVFALNNGPNDAPKAGGGGNASSATPAGNTPPASSQAATVSVNKRFGYGAFAITLGTATFSGQTLSIDALFENLAPNDFQIDPSHLAVVSAGNSYGWSGDPVPNVAGNAKASGTLVFSIFGPFDLENAMLVAGRGEQNQAVVPLAGHGTARLLEPRRERIRGEATAGTLTVKIVDGLVAAGNFQYNLQATKDKVVVHLGLEAGTTEQYGENFVGNHLVLKVPNGEQATPIGGSNEVLTAGGTTAGMFADFEVPAPAIGNFVLIVRQQTNTAEIPFTLS